MATGGLRFIGLSRVRPIGRHSARCPDGDAAFSILERGNGLCRLITRLSVVDDP
jgi:hypothetical protein